MTARTCTPYPQRNAGFTGGKLSTIRTAIWVRTGMDDRADANRLGKVITMMLPWSVQRDLEMTAISGQRVGVNKSAARYDILRDLRQAQGHVALLLEKAVWEKRMKPRTASARI